MRVPMRTWVSGLVGSALLGLGMLGCDGKPSVETSTTEAKVKGTVTIKGKVATKGKVVFDPSNYKRKNESVRQADISADGTYEITTLIGPNTVKVARTPSRPTSTPNW